MFKAQTNRNVKHPDQPAPAPLTPEQLIEVEKNQNKRTDGKSPNTRPVLPIRHEDGLPVYCEADGVTDLYQMDADRVVMPDDSPHQSITVHFDSVLENLPDESMTEVVFLDPPTEDLLRHARRILKPSGVARLGDITLSLPEPYRRSRVATMGRGASKVTLRLE